MFKAETRNSGQLAINEIRNYLDMEISYKYIVSFILVTIMFGYV